MNRQEIEELLAQLPSQQPEESVLSCFIMGTMFIAALVVIVLLPNIMLG